MQYIESFAIFTPTERFQCISITMEIWFIFYSIRVNNLLETNFIHIFYNVLILFANSDEDIIINEYLQSRTKIHKTTSCECSIKYKIFLNILKLLKT